MYKVKKRFRDKYTRSVYAPGDIFASNSIERVQDLLLRGLIELVLDYDNLTKAEIMKLLDERGIKYSPQQKKAELIKLLNGG